MIRKKILVTGASGFIGRQCIVRLVEMGYQVCGFYQKHLPKDLSIEWVCCNLLDPLQTQRAMRKLKPDICLHLAWNVEVKTYAHSKSNLHWLQASIHLFEQFVQNGGKFFIGIGTLLEYDLNEQYMHEKSLCDPQSLYGVCKLSLGMILEKLSREANVIFSWARLSFIYGPYGHPEKFVHHVIHSLLENQKVSVNKCSFERDWLFVTDCADALMALIENNVSGIVNIGSGQGVKHQDLCQMICKILCLDPSFIRYGKYTHVYKEPEKIIADISKIQSLVQFKPQVSLEEGLYQTIEYFKSLKHVKI